MTTHQAEPVVYAGTRGAPVRIAPFDPHGVQPVTIDVQDWIGADTLVNQRFTSGDPRMLIGDGLTPKTIGTGAVQIPLAPTPFLDPATGRQRIRAYYFIDDTVTAEELTLGEDYLIIVSLEAGLFGDDRSLLTELVEK